MAEYGVTLQGFVRKRLADIKEEIELKLKNDIGKGINLLPGSVWSQIIGVYADREDKLWELAEAVYNSQYVDSAEGVNLENVLALISVSKLKAAKTIQQNLHLYGDVGETIPALTKVHVASNPESTFETQADVLLGAGQSQIQRVRFADEPTTGTYQLQFAGRNTVQLDFDATAQDVEDALNELNGFEGCFVVTGNHDVLKYFDVAFVGLLEFTDCPKIVVHESTLDENFNWFQYTQEAIPQGLVDALCTVTGPVSAPAFSLTEIVTPVTGLDRVLNPTDAITGRAVETDPEARLRSKTDQALQGKSTPEAIRVQLMQVEGVTQAIVFENETLTTDGDGIPAKSFRAYVQGGEDQDIWDAIWANKPAGIYPDGTEVGTITDSQGLMKTVRFSRPVVVPTYWWLDVVTDDDFPADGEQQIKDALANFVNSLEIGQSIIIYPKVISALNNIAGIVDIEIKRDTDAVEADSNDNNLAIDINEIAKIVDPATDIDVDIT